jgi:hypothetical protein
MFIVLIKYNTVTVQHDDSVDQVQHSHSSACCNMLNCDCVVLHQHYHHAELWLCCTWSTLSTCWTVTVLCLINTINMLNCDCVVLDQHYEHAELWLCCTWSTLSSCWTVTVLYLINTINMLNCDCVVLDQHYEHAELWLCCTWSTLSTCWTVTVLCVDQVQHSHSSACW